MALLGAYLNTLSDESLCKDHRCSCPISSKVIGFSCSLSNQLSSDVFNRVLQFNLQSKKYHYFKPSAVLKTKNDLHDNPQASRTNSFSNNITSALLTENKFVLLLILTENHTLDY